MTLLDNQEIDNTDIKEYIRLKDRLAKSLFIWNEKAVKSWRATDGYGTSLVDAESNSHFIKWKNKIMRDWTKDLGEIRVRLSALSAGQGFAKRGSRYFGTIY